MSTEWPETPADRSARKVRVQKVKAARKSLPVLDLRTPSGKTLPY